MRDSDKRHRRRSEPAPGAEPPTDLLPERVSGTSAGGVSVVMAAFDEERTVGDVVRGVRRCLPDVLEVIVVDDGSGDRTAEVAREAGAMVIRLDRMGGGKGRAIRVGAGLATGEVLVFLDADGQDDPAEIPLLLEALAPDVSMVIGSRFRGRLLDGSITTINKLGNLALTAAFNLLHAADISDTQAGFRALRRRALRPELLRARAYEIETELTLHVLRGGGRIVEVPVTRAARDHGSTSFVRPYHGLRILWCMVSGRLGSAQEELGPPFGAGRP